MKYVITGDAGCLTVRIDGVLNFSVNEDFQNLLRELLARKPAQVVFDFANVPSVDSVGLGLLYIAHEDLSGLGSKCSIINPQQSVIRLLQLTQADRLFAVT